MKGRTVCIVGLSSTAGAMLTRLASPEWSAESAIDLTIVGFGAFGMGLFGGFTADWWGERGLHGIAKSFGAALVAGMGGALTAMVLSVIAAAVISGDPHQLLVAPVNIILGFYFLLFLLAFLFS